MDNQNMINLINHIRNSNASKHAYIGYDGYIDSLYHVVKTRENADQFACYETLTDFSGRVAAAAGRSADLELSLISRRMGGNAPLMAEALGRLGISTYCIGAMGFPETEAVFSKERVHFSPISICPCAQTTALEFSDGKLMLGDIESLNKIDWAYIKKTVTAEACHQYFSEAEVWGIVNWSFLCHSNDIINGFLHEIVEAHPQSKTEEKIVFFDLADPRSRPVDDVYTLCNMLTKLSCRTKVVLGLNENESVFLSKTLDVFSEVDSPEVRAAKIRDQLHIFLVVIHTHDYAVGANAGQTSRAGTIYVDSPVLSTGAGDNFNAGLCFALLHHLPLDDTLLFANIVSSYYVSHGSSPSLEQLVSYCLCFEE